MRSVEAAVRSRCGRADEVADQLEVAEAGGDAEVAGLAAEQLHDLAVTPEERRDQRRSAIAAREEIRSRARGEQQARELAVVPVARLVKLRPAVVVAAVDVRATVDQEGDDGEVAGHPDEVVAVRPALNDEIRKPVDELDEAVAVVRFDRAVREDEGRRRLVAAAHRFHVAAELLPARVAVP